MWRMVRLRPAAVMLLVGMSGCYFFTDFDDLSGGDTANAGGAGGSTISASSAGGGTATSSSASSSTASVGTGTGGAPMAPAVVINELVADPIPNEEDWIELYNADSMSVDIGGWRFQDDSSNSFTFPSPTVLDPGTYLVFDRNAPGSFTFGFAKDGESLTLITDDNVAADNVAWGLGDAEQPNSWGRLPNGSGDFQTLTPTKGSANQ